MQNNLHKKFIGLMLLIVLAAPVLFYVSYFIQQKIVQAQMKEALEQKMLQTITLKSADVKWIKPNKEILIQGELFDIKNYKTIGDKIIFTGLYDKAETKLALDFAKNLKKKNNQNNAENILKIYFSATIIPNLQYTFYKLPITKTTFASIIANTTKGYCSNLYAPPNA
jgi:hypothetical protein